MERIVIATPLYPPDIGGPAQYAKNLETVWRERGHNVVIAYFGKFLRWPTGLRHLIYFFSLLSKTPRADFILALDTFSVGFSAVVAAKLLGKKIIIRTGGDFLYEWYVERTGDLALLRNFYRTSLGKLNLREGITFYLSRWTVRHCDELVFSTDWQKNIWQEPYRLRSNCLTVVENYYGPKEQSAAPAEKNFLAGTRPLLWKNSGRLAEAFRRAKIKNASLIYDETITPFDKFMDKLARCYGVILVSLGDISPNMILDAIRYNKPFILTRETGLYDRLKEVGIFVDPENVDEITKKLIWLADDNNYQIVKRRVEQFNFIHTWEQITVEFLQIYRSL